VMLSQLSESCQHLVLCWFRESPLLKVTTGPVCKQVCTQSMPAAIKQETTSTAEGHSVCRTCLGVRVLKYDPNRAWNDIERSAHRKATLL